MNQEQANKLVESFKINLKKAAEDGENIDLQLGGLLYSILFLVANNEVQSWRKLAKDAYELEAEIMSAALEKQDGQVLVDS